jgi:GNAT superfamily N-acetyltransferase
MQENELHIDKATRDDVPLLFLLVKELAEYGQLSHAVSAREADIHNALFGEPVLLNAVIARTGRQVTGFASYYWTYSTFRGRKSLYIEDLYVRPALRKQGAGHALMACLAEKAVDADCDSMAWAVLDWNEDALLFYRSLGALPVSEWLSYRLAGEHLARLARSNRIEFRPARD